MSARLSHFGGKWRFTNYAILKQPIKKFSGITVERVEVKDVSLPPSLQRAMAAEAEAAREAKAKVCYFNVLNP